MLTTLSTPLRTNKAKTLSCSICARLSPHVDYFIVCTGTSERQLKAIADGIEEHTLDDSTISSRAGAKAQPNPAGFLSITVDVIIHIFSASQRKFYQLEQLWKEAPVVLKIQ